MLENFAEARKIYERVPRFFPDDPLVWRAWGEMANCNFQLGGADPANYAKALENYSTVTNAPSADLATRQEAQVGIGHVLRRQSEFAHAAGQTNEAAALLEGALQNYLNVVYAEDGGAASDPTWLREAALNAADISEAQRKWDRSLQLLLRLGEKIPALAPGLKPRIDALRKQMELQKQ